MVGKKAQQNNRSGSWPSPPSSTARKPSVGLLADQPSPIIAAPSVSSVSADSFKSVSTSPTDARTPITTRSARSAPSSDAIAWGASSATKEKSGAEKVENIAQDAEDDPVLPMTPKSPDPRSPTTALTSIPNDTASALPARGGAIAQDMEVVEELLATMKQMLGTLGATFDSLGEQTMKVATLPAAIDAVHQISSVRRQLDDQHKRQEQRMQDMKTLLLEEVKTRLYSKLRETANSIVKDIIQREIAERVRQQLYEQIPQKLRDDVLSYKRQIMEVKISLHNSEARRHNALIRTNSLDEPLRPLLRPPPIPRSEWPLSVSIPEGAVQSGSASAFTDKAPPMLPITNRVLSESDAVPPNTGVHGFGRGPRLPRLEIEPPTPSPLFPRDLTSLMRLGPEEAKALVKDYGLVRVRYAKRSEGIPQSTTSGKSDVPGGKEPEKEKEEITGDLEPIIEEESREESLNRFMSYIGVGFQVVPTSPSRGRFGASGPASLTRVL